MKLRIDLVTFVLACVCIQVAAATPPPYPSWLPSVPHLAPAPDAVIVHDVNELFKAVKDAQPKTTIALADGEYLLPTTLQLRADGLTLRSASGDRDRVILDGHTCASGEGIHVLGNDVTIAAITVANVKWNGIKIEPQGGAQRPTIKQCVLHNIWQRGIKCPGVPIGKEKWHPQDGRVEHCLFYNDRPKEFADDETDTAATYNGNYIGGIDMKSIGGWTYADNIFIGIQGRTREGRGSIYLADRVERCVLERNVMIDCDIGIALGNPSLGGDWKIHCTGCTVRNNMITRCPETGLLAVYTKDCRFVHNTVFEPQSRMGRLIWAHQNNENLFFGANLLIGVPARLQGTGKMEELNTITNTALASALVDPAAGNLHLKSEQPDLVRPGEPLAQTDLDGTMRTKLVVGADEFNEAVPRR